MAVKEVFREGKMKPPKKTIQTITISSVPCTLRATCYITSEHNPLTPREGFLMEQLNCDGSLRKLIRLM